MARILLIEAVAPQKSRTAMELTFPMGPMYLAGALRRNASHTIDILDTKICEKPLKELATRLKGPRPDVIGIKAYSRDVDFLASVVAACRQQAPGAYIILGGPHANAQPEQAMEQLAINCLVLHEGEEVLPAIVEHLADGRALTDITGLYLRQGKEVVYTGERAFIDDLDSLAMPAWDLAVNPVYDQRYHRFHEGDPRYPDVYQVREKSMTLFTSRGCPYQCIYCHNIFGKRLRTHSAAYVWRQLATLYQKYGVHQFYIWDDIFNLDARRAHRICDLIISSGYDIRLSFINGLRGDILTEELLYKLKQAGTFFISYAIETAAPRLQKLIKKRVNLDKLKRMITVTSREAGIITQGYFMLGFPGETREELEQTVRYAIDSDLDIASFFVVNPFAGTELGRMAKQERTSGYYDVSQSLCEVSAEELRNLLFHAQIRFYGTQGRVDRTFAKARYFRSH